ncbi:LrgB family protein [Ruthenibacterium lactatiformans]|uniref:LrgB family protein n=1 Tax=Ruthenibacterium lactatiformans TaxID=1550024 RepID=UPI0015663093
MAQGCGVRYGNVFHRHQTSKATELSEFCGAIGSLSLVVAGVLTAALLPVLTPFFSEGI